MSGSRPSPRRGYVGEPLRAALLRGLLERRQLGAGEHLRHAQEANGVGGGEDAELGAAGQLGRVLELEPESCVGLVGAEPAVGLLVGHPRPGSRNLEPDAVAPDRPEHLLHRGEELLLVGERHLDVELGDLLDAVGAQILVAEADRDLVVAVEAGDHRQLFQDLRALREREEPARMQAAGDDEVARSLRRRLEQDRGLDVEIPGVLHVAADDPDHLGAQPEVALELVAPQVEPAVAQAERLVDVLLVELERERRRARHDPQLGHLDLDLARRHPRVDGLGGAGDHLARRLEHELVADLVRDHGRVRRELRVDDELVETRTVAEIDEHQPAVVSPPGRPARQRHGSADMLGSKLATGRSRQRHDPDSLPTTSA